MKRSDVIDSIKSSLIDVTDGEEDEKILIMYSNIILNNLEELGMLPPTTMSEPTYHDNGKQLATRKLNKWDVE